MNHGWIKLSLRGMEDIEEPDDEEQPLVIAEEENGRSPSRGSEPTHPPSKMVADTSGAEAPDQGCPTPKPADSSTTDQTPGSEIPVVESQRNEIPDPLSSEVIQMSLENALAGPGTVPPTDVNFDPNMWANLSQTPNGSSPFFMLSPIFTTLSESERSKMFTDLIINCIQQQRALWDSTHPNFGDNKLCPLLWSNIASVCGYDVKKLKSKWWNLRAAYKREYIKSTTTGVTSKSLNFKAMSFLEGEMKLELERSSHEKNQAAMQLLRRMGDNEPRGDYENSNGIDDDDDDGDDCMIVDGEEQEGSGRGPVISGTFGSTSYSSVSSSKGNPGAQSQPSTTPKPLGIRPRDISELQNRLLQSSASQSSDLSDSRRSPEVICLGKPKEPQKIPDKPAKTKNQYTAVPGQPVITYNPVNNQPAVREVKIEVQDGMPKNWNNEHQSPQIKQCAKKSISRANLTLFPTQNGVTLSSRSSEQTGEQSWKIENTRSLKEVSLTRVEPPIYKIEKPCKVKTENENKPNLNETKQLNKPEDDDDVQIIKEVAVKQPSSMATVDPPGPSKRRRVSSEAPVTPFQTVAKRKVDKNRENSASEHFLLSLLCDVETMTNAEFRRFKERSTALVSMIMDRR